MIGKTFGNFQITAQLGIGGMGEVYQAKDQKLGRDVAIKVLPEEFARDTDRVARFQREAKLLASLNHPNIASIYGLEESDGTHYLVLELIEGDTLADRIRTGPIPVAESLKLALQIAEALEAAHEKGVIHRDLKPANIKITPDGKVKVLDFGLAKGYAGDSEEVNLSNSPTLSAAATQQGVILGTAAYMSPEQARGETVDKRADIWAFGVVLFEMLTGRSTFEGRSVSDILASVLKIEPEWNSLPPNLHSRIRFLLERCLKKEPKNRYSGVSDARVEIQEVLTDPSGLFVQPAVAAKPKKKQRLGLPWVAAAVILSIIIGGLAVWYFRPAEPLQVMRFDYELPPDRQFSSLSYLALAISPDGKQFAYSTNEGLFLRSVDEFAAKLIAGTEGPTSQPFFSPDGKWVGYLSVSDFVLKKININGGAPVALCETISYGADWGADNTIIYGQNPGGVMKVSSNGGNPEPLIITKIPICLYPQMLPDGKTVLYTAPLPQPRIVVQSIDSNEPRELFAGVAAQYVSTGHVIYGLSDSNSLFAVPFDLDTLEVTGGAVPIVENVISPQHYAVSDSGTLVYIPGTSPSGSLNKRTLVWVDRNGKEEPLSAEPNDYRTPRISPDGTKVAWTVYSGEKSDIWTWDMFRETSTRLTFEGSSAYPLWTPDGGRIAFIKGDVTSELTASICWKAADGTGEEEEIGSVPGQLLLPWSWSEDGKTLALFEADITSGVNYNVGILSMEGDREWKSLLNEKHIEFQPMISPDGKWMAYASDESGQIQIYVRPFPDWDKGKWQVSTGGGETPLWSPDGRELFYRNGNAVMAVSVETDAGFNAGKPVTLFQGNYVELSTNDGRPWDIHPDGKRFLMIKPSGVSAGESAAEAPQKINIVLNFFEELKRRAPEDE